MASWASRWNPTPAFPEHTGPYRVGTIEVELPVEDVLASSPSPAQKSDVPTVSFRCFYPCLPDAQNDSPVRWIPSPQRSFISAYTRFAGAGAGLSEFISAFPNIMYYVNIPVVRDAPLLAAPTTSGQWPVMIFSHGLGGSKNAYSYICGSLASHGLIVIAPEHRDGSCPISYIRATEGTEIRTIQYRRISHTPSKEVYDARDEQLRVRLCEIDVIHRALHELNNGTPLANLKANTADLAIFKNSLDIAKPGSVIFAGHSFGACTTVQLVKSVFYTSHGSRFQNPLLEPSPLLSQQITCSTPIILLDLWTLPLKSPNTADLWSKPLPSYAAVNAPTAQVTPPLAVLSEAFAKWKSNFTDTLAVLADPDSPDSSRPKAHLFYPPRSAHLSQSDFGILFPRLTRYLAKADNPARTLRLNVRAMLQALREAGAEVAGFQASADDLEEVDADGEWEVVDKEGAEAEKVLDNSTEVEGWDYTILSKETGKVAGWIAVEVI